MNTQTPVPAAPTEAAALQKAPKNTFVAADGWLAMACFGFGYLYWRWILTGPNALGSTLFFLALCGAAALYVLRKHVPVRRGGWAALGGLAAASLLFSLSANGALKVVLLMALSAGFVWWFYAACGNRLNGGEELALPDLLRAGLVWPFSRFGAAFAAPKGGLSRGANADADPAAAGDKKHGRFGFVLLGLLLALLPTLLVVLLLADGDTAFANLLDRLLPQADSAWDYLKHPVMLLAGIPVALYLFGLAYSCTGAATRNRELMTPDGCRRGLTALRFAPPATVWAGVLPLCAVYLLFFFSQTAYFLSAFSGLAPGGIGYADYARDGFFQLCAVSVINLLVIAVVSLFAKRPDGRRSLPEKLCVTTLCALTLGLIAVALSKMILYIDAFGLTPLRVYTSWFMLTLGVVFALIIAAQFVKNFRFTRVAAFVCAASLLLLVGCDVDARIAQYNVARYQSGRSSTVDIDLFYNLSPSAVPYVLPLSDDADPAVAADAKAYLRAQARELRELKENDGLRRLTLPALRAERLLSQAGYATR